MWAREDRLVHDGASYHLPLPEGQGTGLGKPLKIIAHPVRPRIPIWVASLGPKNVEMTAEVADGWMPLFYLPEKAKEVWGADLDAGLAKRDPTLGPLQIAAGGVVAIGDDVAGIRDFARPMIALYVGGMGAKGTQLLQRPRVPVRLRGRRRRRSRTSTSTATRTRRPRWCPTSCSRPPPSAGPRATCGSASRPTARPASPTSRSRPCPPAT